MCFSPNNVTFIKEEGWERGGGRRERPILAPWNYEEKWQSTNMLTPGSELRDHFWWCLGLFVVLGVELELAESKASTLPHTIFPVQVLILFNNKLELKCLGFTQVFKYLSNVLMPGILCHPTQIFFVAEVIQVSWGTEVPSVGQFRMGWLWWAG